MTTNNNGKLTETKRGERKIMELLAELGGRQPQDDAVVFEGTKFVVPASMTYADAIQFLDRVRQAQEQPTGFNRKFNYRPFDGAHAFQAALKRVMGTTGIGVTIESFFGSQPPQTVSVKTGPNTEVQVPWGLVEIPMLKGEANIGASHDPEIGPVFTLNITCPKKYAAQVEGLFKAIEEELKTNSIYKGQAIDGREQPEIKDTSTVDPSKLVYSEQTTRDLDAQLWRLIEDQDWARKNGIPLKRAVLLEGPYGTGKTEAANITAKKCVENGWTFIQVRANKDDLGLAMQTAKLYQPSVVFFEDVDVVADADKTNGVISRLLDIFDGMDAKHNDVMVVLTTNHVEKIHKGMVRPGRLDGIIHIGALDMAGVEKLAKIKLGEERVQGINWEAVYHSMEGYMPAFVNEALKRAVLYSDDHQHFTTKDLVGAAEGLRAQFELMENAHEGRGKDRFESLLSTVVKDAVNGSEIRDYEGDQVGPHGMKIQAKEESLIS